MEKHELDISHIRVSSEGGEIIKPSEKFTSSEQTPIYLSVDTGVDYAAIATGTLGLIVAALAAWFTLSVQRNQIQANISTLRHHWMTELRLCASEFLQTVSLFVNNLNTVENYRGTESYVDVYSKVVVLQAKIELLLSRDDTKSTKLRRKMSALVARAKKIKYHERDPLVFTAMGRLRDLFRAELERAWIDVKDDLGINKKFFGFRFVSKREKNNKSTTSKRK